MMRARFWLRWSLRDLRKRWSQVAATALVIAIGIAVFAGLGGMRQYREESARRSFEALRFHHLRVTLAEGARARAGQIDAAVRREIAAASGGEAARTAVTQERLRVPTQIDGRPAGSDVLTPGLVIGVPLDAAPGSRGDTGAVDAIRPIRGRGLRAGDDGRRVGVLDRSFANFYKLPASGRLGLAGGARIDYVGQGQSPQYFLITAGTGFGGESTLGVVYTSLSTAQRLARRPGAVDELVLRLPGAGMSDKVTALRTALKSSDQPLLAGAEVVAGTEEHSYTILFRDARNDQRMLGFFGLLVLLGASIAAFNLVSRTVEAERREIGIGMALGLPTRRLALRPLLLGAEIAVAGTIIGALLSAWLAGLWAGVFKQFLPLPVWGDPFRPTVFARGALVGFLLPFAATVWPVLRAVRVQPVEAIRITSRSASGGMVRAATRISLPGGTIAQMPWRNSSRTPRRTLLAVVGLGAVIGAMLALVGVVDSFSRTIERNRDQAVGAAPGRLNVALAGFFRADSPAVGALLASGDVRALDTRLDLPAKLGATGAAPFTVVTSINDDDAATVWRPSLRSGRLPRGDDEIAIAPKAAADLGIGVGDRVELRVTGVDDRGRPRERELRPRVSGITADPFRAYAYADGPLAVRIGMPGIANAASVMPRRGVAIESVQRQLVAQPIVATTRPVTADSDALADTIEQFKGIIRVAAGAALILAVLMAFNLAGIALEERRREYATMFAYGMPVARGLRIAAVENFIVGVLGTALGLGVGLSTIDWIVGSLLADTWPEIGIVRHLSPGSVVVALLTGVLAVTVTPYLLARRLTRMDVPSTLRVVE